MLTTYLSDLPGVSCEVNEDKGSNGYFLKYRSEIGDIVNLTYWKSKSKLMFQGFVMKLYAEIQCFLAGLSIKSEEIENICSEVDTNVIDTIVKNNFPTRMKNYMNYLGILFLILSICVYRNPN